MTKPDTPTTAAGGSPLERGVGPTAAHMVTSDGSKHHLRFDVGNVETTAKRMQQGCIRLYDEATLRRAIATAWGAGYWEAGYTNDAAWVDAQAEALADELLGKWA